MPERNTPVSRQDNKDEMTKDWLLDQACSDSCYATVSNRDKQASRSSDRYSTHSAAHSDHGCCSSTEGKCEKTHPDNESHNDLLSFKKYNYQPSIV